MTEFKPEKKREFTQTELDAISQVVDDLSDCINILHMLTLDSSDNNIVFMIRVAEKILQPLKDVFY